jgi:predicted ribosomally synthesized peptide with SipW-like signal peptide
MKKRTKSLLAAFCTMALCGCLIAGSTYALFTDTANVDISVTSGKVDVVATASLVSGSSLNAVKTETRDNKVYIKGSTTELSDSDLYEFTGVDKAYSGYYYATTTDATQNKVTFTNGGEASLIENKLTISKITPGDSVKLKIGVTNNSNVSVYYRIKFYVDNEYKADDLTKTTDSKYTLFDSLNITVPVGSSCITYNKSSGMGVKSYTTAWTQLNAATGNGSVVIDETDSTIELPLNIGNSAQNKTCDIYYEVEAVQYNANIGDNQLDITYIDSNKSGAAKAQSVTTNENGETNPTTVTLTKAVANGTALSNETSTSTADTSVSVTIPSAALTTSNKSVQVSVTSTTLQDINSSLTNSISITSGSTVYAFDVTTKIDDVDAGSLSESEEYYVTSFTIEKYVSPTVYHKDEALIRYDSSATVTDSTVTNKQPATNVEYYTYNDSTGEVTVYTKSFSPFVISFLFGGGLGTEEKPYLISSALQLQGLSLTVNLENNYSGKYFKLTKDLDLSNVKTWTSIGAEDNPFKGTFDFGSNTISNIKSNNVTFPNLFAVIQDDGVINNLINDDDDVSIITIVSNKEQLKAALTDKAYILLNNNIELDEKLIIDKSITLDLNGNTIKNASESNLERLIVVGDNENFVTLTIKDSSTVDSTTGKTSGAIINTYESGWGIWSDNGSSITINGGNITTKNGIAVYLGNNSNSKEPANKGTLTITGGTFTSNAENNVYVNVGNAVISGGEFTGRVYSLNIGAYGSANITGGTFNNQINVNRALTSNLTVDELVISGGIVNGGIYLSGNATVSGTAAINGQVYISGNDGKGVLTVNGGTITTDSDSAAAIVTITHSTVNVNGGVINGYWEGIYSQSTDTINVNGGTIIGQYSAGIRAEGGATINVSDGTIYTLNYVTSSGHQPYGIYLASSSIATITGGTISANGNSAIYVNNSNAQANIYGGTITSATFNNVTYKPTYGVYLASGAVNIAQDPDNDTRTTVAISQCTNGGVYVAGGTFIMSAGTIDEISADQTALLIAGGTSTVSGGSLTGYNGVYIYKDAKVPSDGSSILTISGGTINSANNCGIYAGSGTVQILGGSIYAKWAINVAGADVTVSGSADIDAVNMAIYQSSGNSTVSGGTLDANTPVQVDGGSLTISGGVITGSRYGVYVTSGTISASNATITGNVYSVCVNEGVTATLTDCTLTGNTYGAVTINNTTSLEDGQ